jgi:hypothetical protein
MNDSVAQGSLSARALLRWQFQVAHELLENVVEQLTAEVINPYPYLSGAGYAHVVLCEDLSVNGVLATRTPLALSTWSGRTGVSRMPSLAKPDNWRAWAHSVRLDFARLRPYARAVYASTEDYLNGLPDDLERPPGGIPACALTGLLLTLSMRRGEIVSLLAE